MSIAQTIDGEGEFAAAMPRHAKAAIAYMEREPSLKLQRWVLARAIVRRPDLATVLFVTTSGERIEAWLSVAPDGEGGWSVLPVLKSPGPADGAQALDAAGRAGPVHRGVATRMGARVRASRRRAAARHGLEVPRDDRRHALPEAPCRRPGDDRGAVGQGARRDVPDLPRVALDLRRASVASVGAMAAAAPAVRACATTKARCRQGRRSSAEVDSGEASPFDGD